MKIITINILLLLSLMFSSVVLGQEALKKNDRIVFLGDSITATGERKDGYITSS
ncbi:hypothetical protein N9C66_01450 [Akkermansiaceae bacterium]|nr:hypothetical protein [Akkermansiaceae bacterium]MDA9829981.1 hypothetical protein [Akkermansiaceae bacterium]MDB4383863.1 hypothetical protein [Akkermansiaceae bacterium]MDB4465504.1 hypothetical protein [Akkermansiaceae bacterium]MDB4572723.1 hypothetical protein [Akkermansiaceae bacterium]